MPSDGEPHQQRHESPGDQETYATGHNPAHSYFHALQQWVFNTNIPGKEAALHAFRNSPWRPHPSPTSPYTVISRAAKPTPLALHDVSIALRSLLPHHPEPPQALDLDGDTVRKGTG